MSSVAEACAAAQQRGRISDHPTRSWAAGIELERPADIEAIEKVQTGSQVSVETTRQARHRPRSPHRPNTRTSRARSRDAGDTFKPADDGVQIAVSANFYARSCVADTRSGLGRCPARGALVVRRSRSSRGLSRFQTAAVRPEQRVRAACPSSTRSRSVAGSPERWPGGSPRRSPASLPNSGELLVPRSRAPGDHRVSLGVRYSAGSAWLTRVISVGAHERRLYRTTMRSDTVVAVSSWTRKLTDG